MREHRGDQRAAAFPRMLFPMLHGAGNEPYERFRSTLASKLLKGPLGQVSWAIVTGSCHAVIDRLGQKHLGV